MAKRGLVPKLSQQRARQRLAAHRISNPDSSTLPYHSVAPRSRDKVMICVCEAVSTPAGSPFSRRVTASDRSLTSMVTFFYLTRSDGDSMANTIL